MSKLEKAIDKLKSLRWALVMRRLESDQKVIELIDEILHSLTEEEI